MSAFGLFGATEENPSPFVTIDSIDYPLVPQSIVEGAPLNPFSPSNTDGNSVAVVSQRHASEVWDDLTAGLGYRDDEPGSHQYANGNLDTRQPNRTTLPPLAGNIGKGAASALYNVGGAATWAKAVYLSDDNRKYSFITWLDTTASTPRRVTANTVSTCGFVDAQTLRGFAEWNGKWYALTAANPGPSTSLYVSTGAPDVVTFAVLVGAVKQYYGLVNFDNKLISYNATDNLFQQFDGVSAWAAYIGGLTPTPGGETVRQLFVWTDKSGSKDGLYCLTTRRLLVYDEEGQQWEPLYYFGDLFPAQKAWAHVNRRDNSLVLTPVPDVNAPYLNQPSGNILTFTPGTVDNLPINKGFGFPSTVNFGGTGTSSAVAAPFQLVSGIHWLYAFCWTPFVGNDPAGGNGGVYAFNEFGGWTMLFDPYVVTGGSAALIGGGYGGGYLLTMLSDGSFQITGVPDGNLDHPYNTYDSQTAGSGHDYYVRSGRIYNKQKNIKKLGSHIEVTFAQPLPSTTIVGQGPAYLKYRFFNENGLSAWQTSAAFVSGAQRMSVSLTDGAGSNGIQYYYMEWELHMFVSTLSAVPPIMESVVLYYTYFQTNRYAYSFNIDLTAETWREYYPDGTFHGNSREYLQTQILAMADKLSYHTFNYSQLFFTESVSRADTLLARRESSDDASGVYSVTVRDLEPDGQSGVFYAG